MANEKLDTNQKARQINLDANRYGTFVEIGAGQEVVRWFFRAGGATEAASLLLKNKADVNQAVAPSSQDQGQMRPDRGGLTGDTPLHLAALCGETNIVQLLLKSGADANALNAAQLTPLDLASSMPRPAFSLEMLQRSMTSLLEPLGVNKPLMSQPFIKLDRIRTAASLIRAAGGKPSLNSRPFGGQWLPP